MLRILSVYFFVLTFSNAQAQIDVDWVQRHGAYTTDRINAVRVDHQSNVLTAGMFTDTLDINGQQYIGAGFLDSYISKLDSNGNNIWLQLISGPKDDQATHLIVLENGDVVAAGSFGDSVQIGTLKVFAHGNDDVWLAKLNGNDGSPQWLISAGSIYAYENIGGLASDNTNIYWAFNFGATCFVGNDTITSQGFNDAAITTLTLDGNFISTNVLTGSGNDNITSLTADASGNVFAGGRFNATFYSHQAVGGFDMFVCKLDETGFDWINAYGGNGSDVTTALTIGNNMLYAAAWSNDTLPLGDTAIASDFGGEMIITTFDFNGAQQWTFHGFPGTTGNDHISATTIACNGDLLFTGYTTYFAAQLPETPLHQGDGSKNTKANQPRCAFGDTYLARMNANGNLLWIKNSLGTNLNSGLGLASDSSGHIYIGGYFTDSLYLKNTAIKGNGGNDAFLFRFTDTVVCSPEIIDTITSFQNALVEHRAILFPNPSTGNTFLLMNTNQPTHIALTDITGKTLNETTVSVSANSIPLFQLFGQLTPSVYFVTIDDGRSRQTLKWVVTK